MQTSEINSDERNEYTKRIIDNGVSTQLIKLLSNTTNDILKNSLRTLREIMCGSETYTRDLIDCNILPYLPELMNHNDLEVQDHAITLFEEVNIQSKLSLLIEAEFLPSIINNLAKFNKDNSNQIARLLMNLTINADKNQILKLINAGVIIPLCDMIKCQNSEVVMVSKI